MKPTPFPAKSKTAAAKTGKATGSNTGIANKPTPPRVLSTHGNSGAKARPILVLVYSNTCYYCQQLRPTWNEAVPDVRAAGVKVVELDAGQLATTDQSVRDMLARTRYSGAVPHIAMVQPGSQSLMEPYTGNRSAASIVQYALNARA